MNSPGSNGTLPRQDKLVAAIASQGLQCPQCQGAAVCGTVKWVECPWCHTTVTLGDETVRRRTFRGRVGCVRTSAANARSGRQLPTDTHGTVRSTAFSPHVRLIGCAAIVDNLSAARRTALHLMPQRPPAATRLVCSPTFRRMPAPTLPCALAHCRDAGRLESDSAAAAIRCWSAHYGCLGDAVDASAAAPSGIDAGRAWLWRQVLGACVTCMSAAGCAGHALSMC